MLDTSDGNGLQQVRVEIPADGETVIVYSSPSWKMDNERKRDEVAEYITKTNWEVCLRVTLLPAALTWLCCLPSAGLRAVLHWQF
jgi:hypothetical protein